MYWQSLSKYDILNKRSHSAITLGADFIFRCLFVLTKVSAVAEASLSVDTTATLVGRLDVLLISCQQDILQKGGTFLKKE